MSSTPRLKPNKRVALGAVALSTVLAQGAQADDFCPPLRHKGEMALNWNPAFVHVDEYSDGDGLTVSSFFNVAVNPSPYGPPYTILERDLVARIPDLTNLDLATFDPNTDVEELTDLAPGMPKTVWPNEAERVPDGVLPFEAVVIPQGFHPASAPGRLTIVDVATKQEYLVHQSTQGPAGPTGPTDPTNQPRFYHRAIFYDVDADGLRDIVTVRSGFRVGQGGVYPPFSELVWFKNPGLGLDPNVEWTETVLYGGPAAGFLGPDITLSMHDFEGDGVPEIVATHFFSVPAGPMGPPANGKIAIYGAPVGGTWADVNANFFQLPRVADISTDQGFPFDVRIVDLDRDGRADVLATNHQPDNCTPFTSSDIPGRVYALEQPASGDIFGEPWTTHILLDDIRPQPTPAPVTAPPGRLAPGHARTFFPVKNMGKFPWVRPHIVVGGDEAGKVWVLRPTWNAFEYDSAVVFDINDVYGDPMTTQTPTPEGTTISTIGQVGVRYNQAGFGAAEFYIPVFEGRKIFVMGYTLPWDPQRISCTPDETLACTP